jgi:hypothetical protein
VAQVRTQARNGASKVLEICLPFDSKAYSDLDLNRLAAYAIRFLDQNDILVTFENIVVALFVMFPKKFSLVGYEQYPDSARVIRSLLQLRPKYRNWATGSAPRGFRLTPAGLIAAEETAKILVNPSLARPQVLSSKRPRTFSPEKETERRVLQSSAFQKYNANRLDDIDPMEVLELLRAVPHTPPNVLSRYLRELENISEEAGNAEAVEFLKLLKKRFHTLFSNSVE